MGEVDTRSATRVHVVEFSAVPVLHPVKNPRGRLVSSLLSLEVHVSKNIKMNHWRHFILHC